MKLVKSSILACGFLGISMVTHANEVVFTANEPMTIIFRVAHQNHNGQPVFDAPQSRYLNTSSGISLNMNQYDLTGVVIDSVNGHELPPSANQFNQPSQCSMTTDKAHAAGTLEFKVSAHEIGCSNHGGIFG